jgi:uncharacterized membrane protein
MNLPDVYWVYPQAAALALLAAVAWWLWCARGHGRWWRALILLLLVLAAMQPEVGWGRGGSDVVLVFDRSSSMSDKSLAQQDEILRLAGEQREAGDRLAVVLSGDGAVVAQGPQATGLPNLGAEIGASASELSDGLDFAASLIAAGRTGRVLMHSDGEFTGLDPARAGNRLAAMAIPVDVLPERRLTLPDAAVVDIELPQNLRLGESFLGAVRLISDVQEARSYKIMRGQHQVVAGKLQFTPGQPQTVSFADRPTAAGLSEYRIELDDQDDRMPLNNKAHAALNVAGGERVLVVGGDGSAGNVANALSAAGIDVVSRPEGPLALENLVGFKVLVLEQVPADKLGAHGLEAIARWVEHLGGGLVMTGGRRSFGAGGYHKSAVECVLPVTMELRDEHRKLAVAMAITLDRSGSMMAPVAGGRTKMDLADEGAAAAVELLSPRDQVAVHAVDSAPHVIVPMTTVSDPKAIVHQILGIQSEGGGIYVYQALLAAGKELLGTNSGTRHLVLFADAADAEEPGDYVNLLADYVKAGITVSVIGMGTERDSDSEFLKDVARRGNGRISFAETPEDIPRLFAQETVLIARSSWINDPIRLRALPALQLELGAQQSLSQAWPTVPGYNLTYPRERATILALAPGDPEAPAIASWRIGTGRSVAVAFSADDPQSNELLAWPGYGNLIASLVRWSAGADDDAPGVLTAERAGRTVTLRLDLDPAQQSRWPATAPDLVLNRDGDIGAPRFVAMECVDAGRYEKVVRLDDDSVILPAVAIDKRAIIGPALALPYSPEAEPRFGKQAGIDTLSGLARSTRGKIRNDVLGLFDNPPSPGRSVSLSALLLAMAMLGLVTEILFRRFQIALRRSRPAVPVAAAAAVTIAASKQIEKQPAQREKELELAGVLKKDDGLHEALRKLKSRKGK